MDMLRRIFTPTPSQAVQFQAQKQNKQNNPFMAASFGNTPNDDYGANQPLKNPMFVGYKDNKPVFAGSRLFVLY